MPPRQYFDTVSHHEGRIEANTELTNQLLPDIPLAVITCDAFHERLGARTGNRTKCVFHFVSIKTDAIVGNGDGLGLGIDGNGDLAIEIICHTTFRDHPELALVDGV